MSICQRNNRDLFRVRILFNCTTLYYVHKNLSSILNWQRLGVVDNRLLH